MNKKNINQGRFVTNRSNTNFFRNLVIFVFIIKVFVSLSITPLINWKYQGHMWLGADGENYLIGVNALSRDGLFSNQEILNYWPAGYPIFIYFFGIFGTSNALTFLGLFQSAIFSYAVYLISIELFRNKFRQVSKILCIFLLFNPTLSLNSLSIGYESLCASGFLIVTALAIKLFNSQELKLSRILLISIGIILSFISSLQPRLIISAIIIGLILFLKKTNLRKSFSKFLIFSLIVISFPAALVARNHFSSGLNVLSINLGTTMNIGAGEGATGGYMGTYKGVPCKLVSENDLPTTNRLPSNYDRVRALNDNKRIFCVLNWYLDNPTKLPKIFWNKTIYFWSPWIGPNSVGTMARNPWFQSNPIKTISKTQEGFNLVYGSFGKFVSWSWVLASFSLLILGLYRLSKSNGVPRLIAGISSSIIFPSWLVTLLTLGDNRFRLPLLGSVIILQTFGIIYLWGKISGKTSNADIF